jgi:hypothetical protein
MKRMAGMSANELCVRGRQEIAKRWDLLLNRLGQGPAMKKQTPTPPASGRFFFTNDDVPVIIRCLREHLPEVADNIIARAEKICEHRFDLLGYESVDYGTEINWHLDAVHGKQAPKQPWFRIPYLDFETVGDSKITWELNRHQHLVTLAKAYRLTADARYARELVQQWYHWEEHNPYGMGINWSSSLEVALRSLSWIWVSNLLNGSTAVPQEFLDDVSRALMVNGRHIERFLSTYFSPNTHLLGEGVGLFFIGTLYPAFRLAARWRQRGWQIVLDEAQRQVQQDGMHFEQALYYHTYALDFFLHARLLAARNGITIPIAFDRSITKMLNALSHLANAGPLPSLGDDDGGRLFDPHRNGTEHMTDPLATGAVLFGRSDVKSVVKGICEETIWLFGIDGPKEFESLPNRRPASMSFALESSGIYVMCSSTPNADRAVIDVGPQAAGRAGHTHADALSLQLAVGGHALLTDPGTAAYVDMNSERNWFRGTGAHNTVQVDGLDQADPAEAFAWQNLPEIRVERWVTGRKFDLLVASHDGYMRLASPVLHRRHIFYLKPHFWLVRDVIDGEGWHRVEASWHFAPGVLTLTAGGAEFSCEDGHGLSLLCAANKSYSQQASQEACSPVYGRRDGSPVLRISTDASVPVEFATLLIPFSNPGCRFDSLQAFKAKHSGAPVRAYLYSTPDSQSYFFFADQGRPWQMGPWGSDAKFLFYSTALRDDSTQFILCEGSYLEFRGRILLAHEEPVAQAEWSSNSESHQASLSKSSATEPEHLFCRQGS